MSERAAEEATDNVGRIANHDEISRFERALFRYATEGTWVAVRSFYHDPRRPPADLKSHRLVSSEAFVKLACQRATHVANLPEAAVFAPPICTFLTARSAAEANLAEGLALSVECDGQPGAARQKLEGLLERATVVVASGGDWIDPESGEFHDKLHLHWRLSEPSREADDHAKLKRARRLAALLAGSDRSAVPMVHPLRWPGSWHLKSAPRLARIVAYDPDAEIHLEDALAALEVAANMQGVPDDDDEPRAESKAKANGSSRVVEDADLMALAAGIPNDANTPWEFWNLVGLAFWAASAGSEAGRAAFQTFSEKSPKDDGGWEARWEHYATSPPTKLSIGKLVYLARQADPAFRLPSWDRWAAAGTTTSWEQPLLQAVAELNARHFVAPLGGQVVIATVDHDDALKRELLVFSHERDIKLRYRHRHYLVGFTQKGAEIWKPLGDAWLEHRNRRNFEKIALIPNGAVPDDTFNLWRGFGVEPDAAGDWPLIEQHLLEIVCAGNEADCDWLIGWMARGVQYPELHAEVAVALRGSKGTGKGTLGRIMQRLFRHHAAQISNPAHFTGRFNGHLVDVLFLFVDEAFWAGDKAGEGTLKGLVTEPTIPIEPKFVNLFQTVNRLKILIASNADWVVPVTHDERRYFVLDVSDEKRGDREYFRKLYAAIEGDELPAFLDFLLKMDLSGFDHRNPPHTAALNRQKLVGADSVAKFWLDCLTDGVISPGGAVGLTTTAWRRRYFTTRTSVTRIAMGSDTRSPAFIWRKSSKS
jgi:Family of unknown function (DUF5906)